MPAVPRQTEEFRVDYRQAQIGRFYSGRLHLAFTSVASLAIIVVALSRVSHLHPAEWLVIPGMFFFANAAEYFGHRGPMHHRRAGLHALFDRHTLEHHRFFTDRAMIYASWGDVKM